jgi:pimeloyl-ACP methyl ester carboxylesterase
LDADGSAADAATDHSVISDPLRQGRQSVYADRFTGPYEHRIFDGIGHNVPQEAPTRFAKALVDLADRETAQPRSRR